MDDVTVATRAVSLKEVDSSITDIYYGDVHTPPGSVRESFSHEAS